MNRILFASLGVLAVGAFTLPAQDKGQKEKPKDDKPAEMKYPSQAEMVKSYGEQQKRVSGAKLTITKAEITVKDETKWVTTIHWEIDYPGPRPPITIYKPSMGKGGPERTCVSYYIDIGNDHGANPAICNIDDYEIYVPLKSDFVTADKDKTVVSGDLEVDMSRKEYPLTTPHSWKTPFYVQLYHSPTERGQRWDLDAWTGNLISNVIEVKFKK